MRRIFAVHDWVLDACGVVPGYIIGLIALGVGADVLGRNLGLGGIAWMLETVEYLLYALTFVGTAYLLRESRHVTVDFLVSGLRPRPRRVVAVAAGALTLAVALTLLLYSASATWSAYMDRSIVFKSFTIPEWLPLAVLPPSAALVSIEALRRLWRAIHEPPAAGERRLEEIL